MAGYLIGPQLRILNPSNIMVFQPSCDDRNVVSFALHSNFANTGAKDQNAVVTAIFIAYELEEYWHVFGMSNRAKLVRNLVTQQNSAKLCDEPELGVYSMHKFYTVVTEGRATPFVVDAGEIVSLTHQFGTVGRVCKRQNCDGPIEALSKEEFLKGMRKDKTVRLVMGYTHDNAVQLRRCSFEVSEAPSGTSNAKAQNYRINFFVNEGFLIMECEDFVNAPGAGDRDLKSFMQKRVGF